MTSWDVIGKAADVVQHTGCDAVRLIGMIAQAANTAQMHKRNCRQFAQHLKLIGNLLEQLKISELKKYPETREPLEQLEDALRRSYILVTSCQDRSYPYLLAMGWKIVYQFREAQNEIDRCLKLIPLITLVDNTRVRERLEVIEMDQREYALDDEDQKVKSLIFAQEPCKHDTLMLKKTLSCSYPNMCFNEALRKENEKLKLELQQSRANLDVSQCEVIQHLLDVIEAVASNSLPDDGSPVKRSEKKEKRTSGGNSAGEHSSGETYSKKTNRNSSSVSLDHDQLSSKGSYDYGEWHTYLLGCCSEPLLCIKTLFCPNGTFSRIASVAKGRHMSSAEACICFLSCSLIFSCCCYTCCVRRKLRKMLNIRGGCCHDLLSHLMCCCCALVQEWREVKIRGIGGTEKAKTGPPPSQYMEY